MIAEWLARPRSPPLSSLVARARVWGQIKHSSNTMAARCWRGRSIWRVRLRRMCASWVARKNLRRVRAARRNSCGVAVFVVRTECDASRGHSIGLVGAFAVFNRPGVRNAARDCGCPGERRAQAALVRGIPARICRCRGKCAAFRKQSNRSIVRSNRNQDYHGRRTERRRIFFRHLSQPEHARGIKN